MKSSGLQTRTADCNNAPQSPNKTKCLNISLEYPPEPTHSYDVDQIFEEEDYDTYGPIPTQITMITEDTFPYITTTESHYAKEDTEIVQVGQLCAWSVRDSSTTILNCSRKKCRESFKKNNKPLSVSLCSKPLNNFISAKHN